MRSRTKPSPEAQGVLRALRRAQLNALERGIALGLPVWVMKNNQKIDLTKDTQALAELQTQRAAKTTPKRGTRT